MVQYDQENTSSHFMGAIVSVPAKSVPVGVSKFLIIDGQQRLTTISLLLCALRDSVDEKSAARVHEVYLINKFRDPEDTLKFTPTQVDRESYLSIVMKRPLSADSSLLVRAYQFFKDRLDCGLDPNGDKVIPARVLTTIEHALQVVMINLGETDDPYLIFESLNFKGEPLTQADLVRNYILMQFKHSISANGEQERVFNQYWRPLENQMGLQLTEFLRYYAMRHGENIYLGGIYAATKAQFRKFDNSDFVERELSSMQRFGLHYAKILKPELEPRQSIRFRLSNLRFIEVATSYPLVLRLMESNTVSALNDADLEKCLGLVESFIIRRAVCGVPTNNLNKLFLQWSKSFPAQDHANWLHISMSSGGGGRRFPSNAEFGEAYRKQPQYGRGPTRFILMRLEQSFGHKEPADFSACTIEHILPQTLTAEWESELGREFQSVHDNLLHTIGNLTLTAYNAELGNVAFRDKKLKLKSSHIELNDWIVQQDTWTSSEILKRADILLTMANQIWSGPTAS